ncbi:hypothetical protein FRB98_006122 [Tulasnella sp. 332]|nr:hypothetical protein FRB98_006122 [Tulasnella sp. 332]
MSISSLVSISWRGCEPDPKAAETDVLVLTGHSYFVDLRVRRGTKAIDWAFAGTRTSQPGDHEGETLCTWSHLISSRVAAEAHTRGHPVASDSGVNSPHLDDPSSLTLERGRMLNPATGVIEEYAEVWRDYEVSERTLVVFLERGDGKAFIGMIGKRRIGVGIGWAWRADDEGDNGIWSFGKTDGSEDGKDVVIHDSEGLKEGEGLQGGWIIRELWRT